MTTTHDSADTQHETAAKAAAPVVAPAGAEPGLMGGPSAGPLGLLAHPALGGRGNGAARVAAIQRLQRTQGNRATRQILQRLASQTADAAPAGGSDLAATLAQAQGGGQPLDPAARARLEPAMGQDLGQVSIHADNQADSLTRAVQAEAFAHGPDIYFRNGQYDPHSEHGQQRLAHELAHVGQQERGAVSGRPHPTGVLVSEPGDGHEQAAEAEAGAVMARVQRQAAATVPNTPAGAQEALPRALGATGRRAGGPVLQRRVAQDDLDGSRSPGGKTPAPTGHAGFNRVKAALKTTATEQKKHAPLAAKTDAAVAAAKPPPNERESLAGAKQIGVMGEAPQGVFDKAGFVTKMVNAVSGIAPRSKEELGNFPKSGKAQGLQGQLQTEVTSDQQQAQQGLDTAAKQPPNPGAVAGKTVTPLTPEAPGAAPQVAADGAAPDPHPAAETALDSGPAQVQDKMAANSPPITEEQLQKANEPGFSSALRAKKTLDQNAVTAPAQFKQQEGGILDGTKHQMQSGVDGQLGRMYKGRTTRLGQVGADQHTTQGKDEARHQEVTDKIGGIYTQTKADVDRILQALPGKVNGLFESGAATASHNLEQYVQGRVDALSNQRHELSWDLWKDVGQVGNAISDTFAGIPDDQVAPIYNAGRQAYIDEMTRLATSIANTIEAELSAAKSRIARGKADIDRYVNGLPQDLQQVGRDAQREMGQKFDDLSQDIDTQVDQLQADLTSQFTQAGQQADDLLKQMQAENKGLLGKAMDAIAGTISTINGLKDLLLGVLSKARDVIGRILSDPIGFLGNLVAAVGQGLNGFVAHIGKHLQDGLTGWLFGALGGAGIQLPATLDLQGIVSVATQVLGLTYDHVRQRAVKIVGAQAVGRVEQVAGFFQTLLTGGIGGLWTFIKDQLGNLKEMILGEIQDWVTNRVVQAGISWLLGLLTPAGAFIKACQTIINIVQFFLERGSQILTLVNSILDSLGAIAAGNLGAAAKKVEDSLANALPVAISFLASLLGLGGISGHIRKLIEKAQEPINKAIDTAIKRALKGLQWVLNSPAGQAVTGGIAKGKAAVTGAYNKGKAAVTGAYNTLTGKDQSPATNAAPHTAAKGPAPAVAPLTPVEKGFTMQGEGHTLIATLGPAAQVEMASKRDLLSNKIGRAVGRVIAAQRAAEREQENPQLDEARKDELAKDRAHLNNQKNDLMQVGRDAKALQKACKAAGGDPEHPYTPQVLDPQIGAVLSGLDRYANTYSTNDVENIRSLTVEAATKQKAEQVIATPGARQGSPVLTGVIDRRSGKIFYGLNSQGSRDVPQNLHPLLKARLRNYQAQVGAATPVKSGTPGAHSEIYALNDALHEHQSHLGRPLTDEDLDQFIIHNEWLGAGARSKGTAARRCEVCFNLTRGVRVTDSVGKEEERVYGATN